jgi:hypothetical protein
VFLKEEAHTEERKKERKKGINDKYDFASTMKKS